MLFFNVILYMQHEKKKVLINPCQEKWSNMTGEERKRLCATCREHVHDVSHLDLKTITDQYLGSGKCIRMNESQSRFFQFMRSLPKAATLSAALALFPFAYGQDSMTVQPNMSRVSGRLEDGWIENKTIYVIVDGTTYETQTDTNGFFVLHIPRNKRIEDSNVIQLRKRKVRKEHLELKNADLPMDGFIIGSF